jgi:hypothetical protein
VKRKTKILFLAVVDGAISSASAQPPHYSTDHGIVGGRGLWPFLLYLGYLIFLGASFYTKQTEFYVWTITREKSPVVYWWVMTVLTALAIWFGVSLWKDVF